MKIMKNNIKQFTTMHTTIILCVARKVMLCMDQQLDSLIVQIHKDSRKQHSIWMNTVVTAMLGLDS